MSKTTEEIEKIIGDTETDRIFYYTLVSLFFTGYMVVLILSVIGLLNYVDSGGSDILKLILALFYVFGMSIITIVLWS